MNLNPLFIFEFDHDGWPLCPRCGFSLTTLAPLSMDWNNWPTWMMKHPMECARCDWKTPTALDPNHTLNLANCTVSLRSKWEEMTNSLPRLKLQECEFDRPKATHCWKMWFGVN